VKEPGGLLEMAGRTPWLARIPLDPLLAGKTNFIHAARAGGSAG
jgi:hypothetical protein